jgi:hypothetical protein
MRIARRGDRTPQPAHAGSRPRLRRPRFGRIALRIVQWAGVISALHGTALAQPVGSSIWVTDGTVRAIRQVDDKIYLGGTFEKIGPPTGGAAVLSTVTGKLIPNNHPYLRPKPVGIPNNGGNWVVNAVIPDGGGGWFVGGSFSELGGVPCSNLAHVTAAGWVSPFNPLTDGAVRALALTGSTLYVGGSFRNVNGIPRSAAAAINLANGEVTSWNPSARFSASSSQATVECLLVGPSSVFVGGMFDTLGGAPRTGIAEVDLATGSVVTTFRANTNLWETVHAMVRDGTELYLGGNFTRISGVARSRLAQVDAQTGALRSWSPNVSGTVSWKVHSLLLSGGRLYVGGDYSSINSSSRANLAAFQLPSANVDPAFTATTTGPVRSLATDGYHLYVGGEFGSPRNRLERVRLTTGALDALWDPGPLGSVRTLAVNGTSVLVGGNFSSIAMEPRRNLAALSAETHWLTTPAVTVTGSRVNCIAGMNGVVYLGGSFNDVNGVARSNLAAVDNATGALLPGWSASTEGEVYALETGPSSIYVAGLFYKVNDQTHYGLAELDPTDGSLRSWPSDPPSGYSFALARSGTTMYVGGSFSETYSHTPRSHLAAYRTDDGSLLPWDPSAGDAVWALSVSGDTVFAGGGFKSVAGSPRSRVAAISGSGFGSVLAWLADADSTVRSLVLSPQGLYIGGLFSHVNGQSRRGVAAVDAGGTVTAWNADLDGNVLAIDVVGSATRVGGDFQNVRGQPRRSFAWFVDTTIAVSVEGSGPSAAPPRGLRLRQNVPNPASGHTRIGFSLAAPGLVDLRLYDVQGRESARPVRGALLPAGSHEIECPLGGLRPGLYFYRLRSGGHEETRRLVVSE